MARRTEIETTPPPRLREQGDTEAEGQPSASDTGAAKKPNPRATSRARGGVTMSTSAGKTRVTVTLSDRAAKRLSNFCHVKDLNPGDVVDMMIMHPSCGLPKGSSRVEPSMWDNEEDRQEASAA